MPDLGEPTWGKPTWKVVQLSGGSLYMPNPSLGTNSKNLSAKSQRHKAQIQWRSSLSDL